MGASVDIDARIKGLAAGSSGDPFEVAARKHGALPLYHGWDGWLLLTTGSEVVEEVDGQLRLAVEPWRTFGLVIGAERYPELRQLLPTRPSSARDCPHCKGTGWLIMNDKPAGFRCGHCYALGWVNDAC